GTALSGESRSVRMCALPLLAIRDREGEGAPSRLFALDRDSPVVALDDPLADRQPDAAPGVLVAPVQPFEHAEDALCMARVDADAVVRDVEQPAAFLAF